MADGKTHATTSLVGGALTFAALTLAGAPEAGILIGSGCVVGIVLTPDLDMPRGPILWRLYWKPYELAIAHRSVYSHAPILGTFGRFAYLVLPALLILAAAGIVIPDSIWPVLLKVFAGLCVSDTLHAILDALPIRWSKKR